ncbi:S8 family peptidase [Paractinoplanes bogorensis]|uniref:S8 family peptidase n=1 Tax=Paractinoplanes bogorensis TaxID=1610840 RepID=UPI0027E14DF8|nr:S8 family serine peptidase [Actinoplanes bogorensis]
MTPSTRLTGALAGLLIGAGSVAVTPPGPVGAATPSPAPAVSKTQSITLITGDVVRLDPAGTGRVAVTVRPGPGREGMSFTTVETDRGVRVVPADAVPLLADGRVDAELFDVQHLIDEGYGDAAAPTLPLIVRSDRATATARTLGAAPGTTLPSLNAVAVRADKRTLADFWRTGMGSATDARSATTDRVWLDGKVRPALDRSTAQIGAPEAWKAGLDGRGVTVAVLDTGADATHPDLAGRIAEARDFSDSGGTGDHFGHGTHVAATVAGSGAGSNGLRKGVAPGAKLLIGKVLDDGGVGYESGIIAGMEWAAGAGAKVVNMSLGGGPTDGTDPMSAAVDELSASTGALFVVAAGNDGDDEYTVGTPGAAPSALTVGAVDREDRIAGFSSRGPRFGDEGLKPEITAPGVGIVAARAAGTAMGEPVDDLYTAASGTSMATPHVAGAAAIVAQQHPDWTGARIKDELVSTAKTTPDSPVYEQGAGRVDVARATSQTIAATGVADFGLHALGDPAQSRPVTYTNTGATPVTLTLRSSLPQITAPATVTVPAGGRADVTLGWNLPAAGPGRISGWLTATGPGGVLVTTAIGGTLDRARHLVTFQAVGPDGQPAAVPVLQAFGDDRRFDVLNFLMRGETKTFQLAEGDYLVDASIPDNDPQDEQDYLVTIPELKVDRDLTVTLDARTARPIRIETPKPAEQRTVESYYVHRVTGSGREITNGFMNFSNVQKINVTPTKKLRSGQYEFSSRWQLVAPMVQASIPGVDGDPQINLCVNSPAYDGTRRFDLVKGLGGNVRGKAVVLESDNPDEASQAAATAGAAVVFVVLPADRSAWQPWDPSGEVRMPIPSALVAHDDGQRILARAARPGARLTLTLTPDSPFLYDVFQVSKGTVPAQIVHRVTAANSYRISSRYADNGGFDWIREQRFGWRPYQDYSWNDASRSVRTPSVRDEWVSTGDSIWQHQVHHEYPWNNMGGLQGGIRDAAVSYPRAGSSAEAWYAPIVRPATPVGQANTRTGNILKLRVGSFVDSTDRHWLVEGSAGATLSRDGTVLAELPDGWQDVPVPAGDATYRLDLATARSSDEWQYGTSTSTSWTFKSGPAGTLPLLQISYRVTALPGVLDVRVPGAQRVKVALSADDGATWKDAVSLGTSVLVPAGKGTVSIRVSASDKTGNTVTQTVIRAYGRAS